MNLWIFYWRQGGYNSVRANTRDEALCAAKHLARYTILTVDENSLHVGTLQELSKLDRQYVQN